MRPALISRGRSRGFLALVAGLGTAVGMAAGSAAAAAAPGGVGFRVDGSPGSALQAGYLTLSVPAGGTGSGRFIITNTLTRDVRVSVYPSDGLTGATTGVVYGDAGDRITGAGGWITPNLRGADLRAESEQPVSFSVRVPAGADPGDHVGSVTFEQVHAATGGISQVVRNVVPVRIVVPGPASAEVEIVGAGITQLPGSTLSAVQVTLENRGLLMCQPGLTVQLTSSAGTSRTVTRQLDTILPGDRAPYPLPWPEAIPAGNHLGKVSVSGCGAPDSMKAMLKSATLEGSTDPVRAKPRSGADVVTAAAPGAPKFSSGTRSERSTGAAASSKTRARDTTGPADPATALGPPAPTASGRTGFGTSSPNGTWLAGAQHTLAVNAPAVLERATVPLLLLLLIGHVFFAQEAIDRRDPKLALAPLHREADLPFMPNLLVARPVIPSPSGLAPKRQVSIPLYDASTSLTPRAEGAGSRDLRRPTK